MFRWWAQAVPYGLGRVDECQNRCLLYQDFSEFMYKHENRNAQFVLSVQRLNRNMFSLKHIQQEEHFSSVPPDKARKVSLSELEWL